MPATDNGLTTKVLTLMRARRHASTNLENNPGMQPPLGAWPVQLREANFSDYSAVTELKGKWGLIPDSFANWERLWRKNPALRYAQGQLPMGWVLEAQDKVVGYLGNIPLRYHYGSQALIAVAGHGFVVEPAYRAMAMRLNSAFYRQVSVDLYLTTTAIEAVGKIARAFKCDALPQEDYDTVLFWVLQPYPFARAVMKKLEFGPITSYIGGTFVSLALASDKILRSRWPHRTNTSLSLKQIRTNEIGDDFEQLWLTKLAGKPRLLANRDAATLRWHFQTPDDPGETCVFCCYKKGVLVGYTVMRTDPNQANVLRRSTIADTLAIADDPEIVRLLWTAAYEHAKHVGSHVLEILGFPRNIRQACCGWHPYRRSYPACPFYYKAADPLLQSTLSNGGAWYASPFDGDTSLMPLCA
jgi:hypothetical protein